MKTFISCIAMLILHINSLSGQTSISLDLRNRIDTTRTPLIFVDSFRTDMNHLILGPKNIASINIFRDSAATSKFGRAGKDGVIMISVKAHITLLRVGKILNEYKLPDEDKNLRICINKTLIRDPQLILIDKSEIERVEVTTDRHWTNSKDANSGEKFINIVTRTKGKNGL